MAGSSSGLGGWTEGLCLKLTQNLASIAGPATPGNKTHITGTLNYFVDMMQMPGFEAPRVDDGDGSRNESTENSKKVRVVYTPRLDPANASTTWSASCASGNERPPCDVDVETTREIESEIIQIPDWQLRRLCEPVVKDYGAASAINAQLIAVEKRFSDEINTVLAANVGVFEDGLATKTFRLINAATGGVWALGEAEMQTALVDSRYAGRINVLGAGNWNIYRRISGIGGLADTGILTNELADWTFYYDTDLAGKLATTDHALVVENGSTHLLTWRGFEAKYAESNDERVRATIKSPHTGLIWDLIMDRTNCVTGKNSYEAPIWDIKLSMAWDLFNLPSDVYTAGDDLDGVNGVYDILGTNV